MELWSLRYRHSSNGGQLKDFKSPPDVLLGTSSLSYRHSPISCCMRYLKACIKCVVLQGSLKCVCVCELPLRTGVVLLQLPLRLKDYDTPPHVLLGTWSLCYRHSPIRHVPAREAQHIFLPTTAPLTHVQALPQPVPPSLPILTDD